MTDRFPSHVEWLSPRIGGRLEEEVHRQGGDLDRRGILAILCEADPSAKKLSVQWIAERFLDGGFLWEDVRAGANSKVHETLAAFGTYRRALNGPEGNLASHVTLASAWKAVAHLMPGDCHCAEEPGGREIRRRERAVAREESIILCERPGLTVAVPLTERASKWWGRGTRWCTAADKNNAFEYYNQRGPLIVIVMPDEKLQLFVDRKGNAQFMEPSDDHVSIEAISRRWDDLGPLLLWVVARTPRLLGFIPPAMQDRAMCLAAVRQDGFALGRVAERLRDREICTVAMSHKGWALQHVPMHLVDRDMCMAAVKQQGHAIADVPDAMMDADMCLAAVGSSGGALHSVPARMRSADVCMRAVTEDGWALVHVPKHVLTYGMCLAAVAQNGLALKSVPDRFRDADMCTAAVWQAANAVSYIPHALFDVETCRAAVARHWACLRMVPVRMRDLDLCRTAVAIDDRALNYVPMEFRHLFDVPVALVFTPVAIPRGWSPEESLAGLADALALDPRCIPRHGR